LTWISQTWLNVTRTNSGQPGSKFSQLNLMWDWPNSIWHGLNSI